MAKKKISQIEEVKQPLATIHFDLLTNNIAQVKTTFQDNASLVTLFHSVISNKLLVTIIESIAIHLNETDRNEDSEKIMMLLNKCIQHAVGEFAERLSTSNSDVNEEGEEEPIVDPSMVFFNSSQQGAANGP